MSDRQKGGCFPDRETGLRLPDPAFGDNAPQRLGGMNGVCY